MTKLSAAQERALQTVVVQPGIDPVWASLHAKRRSYDILEERGLIRFFRSGNRGQGSWRPTKAGIALAFELGLVLEKKGE